MLENGKQNAFRIRTGIKHRTHFSDQQMAVLGIWETHETANHLTRSNLIPFSAAESSHPLNRCVRFFLKGEKILEMHHCLKKKQNIF